MPMHDWTRVGSWVYHDFHTCFLVAIKRGLNALLPSGFYAMAEQSTRTMGPDVLTLQSRTAGPLSPNLVPRPEGGVAPSPPRVAVMDRATARPPGFKQKRIAIRHSSNDRLVAILELVSPGNKAGKSALRSFTNKIVRAIDAGIHVLVIDPFPPTRRDPNGLHGLVWPDLGGNDYVHPPSQPLALASYEAGAPDGDGPRCYVQPFAVGDPLPEIPLFLARDWYVTVPFEPMYLSAMADVLPLHRAKLEENA
jgi:Protein of unknown function (DUF4058)